MEDVRVAIQRPELDCWSVAVIRGDRYEIARVYKRDMPRANSFGIGKLDIFADAIRVAILRMCDLEDARTKAAKDDAAGQSKRLAPEVLRQIAALPSIMVEESHG